MEGHTPYFASTSRRGAACGSSRVRHLLVRNEREIDESFAENDNESALRTVDVL